MTTPLAPRFSVLVANHNHAGLVCRAVDSVLQQDYPAELREVIVVDDGSTDDSRERLARYAGAPGVVVIEQANRGQTGAFAEALRHARGDFVCLLDSDDTCLPNKLAVLAAHLDTLRATPDNLFLCHDMCIVDTRSGQPIAMTWFDVVGLRRMGPSLHMSVAAHGFPFSVTSGMVFGRALLVDVMARVPQWEWPMGSDLICGQTAMVLAGEVQYVHEPLGGYFIHEKNDAAALVDGQYRQKPVWQSRTPRMLRYLELLVDSLDQGEAERQQRLGYLGMLEHRARAVPQGRRHLRPLLSFIVDATAAELDPLWADATAAAVAAQSEPHHEAIWICTERTRQSLPAAVQAGAVTVAAGSSTYSRMQAGWRASRGGYLCFLDAGDLPERKFVERHLHTHRATMLPMLTVSDLRLLDAAGAVLHASIQGTAGGWGRGASSYVGTFSGLLRDWPLAPLPAVVLRRSPLLDAFFAADALPVPDRHVGWLLCQYLLQMGGAARLAENLMAIRLPAHATANASWLSQFIDREGPIPTPDFAACAEQLFAAYARAGARERSSFTEPWEARFVTWLVQSGGGNTAVRIDREARRSTDAPWATRIAAALRAATTVKPGGAR